MKMLKKAMMAIEYGDVFMNVVYRTRPYEKVAGSVNELHEHWKEICIKQLTADKVRMKNFNNNLRTLLYYHPLTVDTVLLETFQAPSQQGPSPLAYHPRQTLLS